jgi:uncharacterized membrane protein
MANKKTRIFLFGFLLIAIVLSIFVAKTCFEKPRSITEYAMELHVVMDPNEIGVDAGPEKLNFGWINPGTTAARFIKMGNFGQKAKVKLVASGDFADWVSIPENNFVLETGESKEIAVKATVPSGVQPGNYSAIMRVKFYNVNFF